MKINTDYPGGNIKVIALNGNKLVVEQELRDTTEEWFYWNFLLEDIPNEEITVEFAKGEVVGPWGPAVSFDNIEWNWLGKDSLIDRKSFRYRADGVNKKVFFSFSLPYLLRDFKNFLNKYSNHPLLSMETLTVSEQGRAVPVIRLGNPLAKKDIVFTCRSHACESIASYILEGVLSYFLDQDPPLLYPLLRHYMIHVIPFVDLDGVENGDQGKSRSPHDHNRDYTENPIYQSVAAIMRYVKKLNLEIGVDFHSLYKWGNRNDYPLFVRSLPPFDEEVKKLGFIFRQVCFQNFEQGKMVYEQLYDKLAYDPWNPLTQPIENFDEALKNQNGSYAASFFRRQNAKLAFTFESPYFGKENNMVTQKSVRLLGVDFARALELYTIN